VKRLEVILQGLSGGQSPIIVTTTEIGASPADLRRAKAAFLKAVRDELRGVIRNARVVLVEEL
jgi:hypothetical protein